MQKKLMFQTIVTTMFVGVIFISLFTFSGTSNTNDVQSTDSTAGLPTVKMYLTLTGETQGRINGDVQLPGLEDSIEVLAFTHSVISPRDAASGLPTGKRQHKPITITKPIDKATPLLFAVLARNENIPTWRLDFWRTDKTGKMEQYYTIELVNAAICGINQQATVNGGATERVSFTYQKIIWTWQDGGIVAEDDWESPVAG